MTRFAAVAAMGLLLGACAVRIGPFAAAVGSAGVRDCEGGYTAVYDPETGAWEGEGCAGRLRDIYGGPVSEEAARAIGGGIDAGRGIGARALGVPVPP